MQPMTPAPQRSPDPSIPIVDIGGLADLGSSAARAAAERLCRAYETVGFAYIAGHGVAESVIDRAFASSAAFHASSPTQKQSLAINRFHRGYIGMASSTIVTSSVARVTRPNLSESLMLMHEVAPDDPALGQSLQGPNQWPDWLPDFRSAIDDYRAALEAVSRRLLGAFTLGLGLPAGYFTPMFAKPVTFLRLLHYPPHPASAEDDQFGAAPHTDYGCMTLLAQHGVEGLAVRSRAGDWVDAPPVPGSFLLNLGDIMPRWSNDRFVSTPHRVVNRSGRERYSIAYFFDPAMDAVIDCLPTCRAPDNPPRYPPVRYGDYLLERLDKNYAYRKTA
jgi:isopenicillin N synthase-like dioxygenase